MSLLTGLRALKQLDSRRAGLPGEHWAAFSTGAALFRWGGRSRSPLLRNAARLAAVALVVRSVTGRDGLLTRMRQPRPRASSATPWRRSD